MSQKNKSKQRNKGERTRLEKQRRAEIEAREAALDPRDEELLKQLAAPDPEEAEELQKHYDEPMVLPGATSWDELDADKIAQEQAEAVSETTWDVRRLVSNILYHPEMSSNAKAKAIAAVGEGFGDRVDDVLANVSKERDMDLLEAESLLAHDERTTGVGEKVFDILKRKLSSAARKNLSSSEFALPDERAYPIHDKAHVRNALARAAQQMKGGGAGAERAKRAMPKIRAAAKKMGIETSMQKEANSITIEKDAAGDWRWVGWVSNNFEDHSGDIITEAAHVEYVEWVNKELTERAPVFTSCHAPGTVREHPVDFVGYENGFLVMSGKLNEGEAEALLRVSKETELGMSHTGWGFRKEADPRQITKYRIIEVTDLPLDKADNPFTTLDTFSKEDQMDQLAYLTSLLGSKEKAEAALKTKTSLAQAELKEAGIESKEKQEEKPADPPATTPVTNVTNVAPNPDIKAIIKQVEEEFGMKDLAEMLTKMQSEVEKVPVLEDLIKGMLNSEDERLAEKLTPPAARYVWMKEHRASESEKTVVKEDDPIKTQKPEASWLSEVFGGQPEKVQ